MKGVEAMNDKDSSEVVQYLADRAAIHDVLVSYFRGLDRCDRELVRNCFTDDVHVHYDKRPPVSGIDAVMAHFRTFDRMEKGAMKVTTHFMGNLNVKYIRDDTAETETNAIAFMVEPADVMAMRSLRYIDRFRRDQNSWRISDRLHTLDWSCRIPTTFGATLAQRVFTLPQRS
jgi:ketosteroid isomerase-like protein